MTAAAADKKHVPQDRHFGLKGERKRAMVETAKAHGGDEYLGLRVRNHERKLPVAEDRHERIAHRSDAHASKMHGNELPPVRELEGNDIALADAAAPQPARDGA